MGHGRFVEREICGTGDLWNGRFVERKICGTEDLWNGRFVERKICGRLGSLLLEDFDAGSGVGLGHADELGRADDRATGSCLRAIGDEEGSHAGSRYVPAIS